MQNEKKVEKAGTRKEDNEKTVEKKEMEKEKLE